MAQNDFLEGVRKGMMAYMQTRNMMQQYEQNQLQMEGQQLQMETERMRQDAYKRVTSASAPSAESQPPKPQKWVPQSLDEAIRYQEELEKIRSRHRGSGKGGSGGGNGEQSIGKNFLGIISNLPYDKAKELTEATFKGSTLEVGKDGDYQIIDKNKEIGPVEADEALGAMFAKFGRDPKEFAPGKYQEMRRLVMTNDPDTIMELESALYAGGVLKNYQKKIAQIGDPQFEAALTKAVADWYLGASDGTIFKDKTAPQSEEELNAQIQEFLSGSGGAQQYAGGTPGWFRAKVLKYGGKAINKITSFAASVPPTMVGGYAKAVGKAFSYDPEQKWNEKYPKREYQEPKGQIPLASVKPGTVVKMVTRNVWGSNLYKINSVERKNGTIIYKAVDEYGHDWDIDAATLRTQFNVD